MYSVTSESGETYLVDPELPGCECPDFEYRDRIYKHLRRVAFATGRREIPEWVDPADVDPQLGIHVHDIDDVGDGPEESSQSEPADFGGGESTGVQQL